MTTARTIVRTVAKPVFSLTSKASSSSSPGLRMVVGNNGFIWGARASNHPTPVGTLVHPTFEGELIWSVQVNSSSDICVVDFGDGGGIQIAGASSVLLRIIDGPQLSLPWNPDTTRFAETDADMTAYIVGQEGNVVTYELELNS